MDDRRVGLVIRALRRRRAWRQIDLAQAAGLSQAAVSRAEAGHFGTLSIRAVRAILSALDARLNLDLRWRGGELDRVVDARHAGVVAAAANVIVSKGWMVLQEVTYAIYGERGSIDLVGVRELESVAIVLEIKSELSSWEETQRRFDEKVRLLPSIVYERLGWRPRTMAKVIVLAESMTNRRRVALLGAATSQAYPASSREIRQWLAEPVGGLSRIWFLSHLFTEGVVVNDRAVPTAFAAQKRDSLAAPRSDSCGV